jgi:DNA-binding transcriptional ArsR family regulator
MANSKVTKRENFADVRAIVEASDSPRKVEILAFLDHEVELLDNKRAKSKESKGKVENRALAEVVIEILAEANIPLKMADLLADERIAGFTLESGRPVSTPKLSAVIAPMVRDGRVVKTFEKKTPLYSLNEDKAE